MRRSLMVSGHEYAMQPQIFEAADGGDRRGAHGVTDGECTNDHPVSTNEHHGPSLAFPLIAS